MSDLNELSKPALGRYLEKSKKFTTDKKNFAGDPLNTSKDNPKIANRVKGSMWVSSRMQGRFAKLKNKKKTYTAEETITEDKPVRVSYVDKSGRQRARQFKSLHHYYDYQTRYGHLNAAHVFTEHDDKGEVNINYHIHKGNMRRPNPKPNAELRKTMLGHKDQKLVSVPNPEQKNEETVEEGVKKNKAAYARFWAHDPETGERIKQIGKKERAENRAFKKGKQEINRLKARNEETEQLDEISKELAQRYFDKNASLDDLQSINKQLDSLPKKDRKAFARRKITNRQKGLDRAFKRYTAEETEQLDELSKKTLSSYIEKSKQNTDRRVEPSGDGETTKRGAGLLRAIQRLYGNQYLHKTDRKWSTGERVKQWSKYTAEETQIKEAVDYRFRQKLREGTLEPGSRHETITIRKGKDSKYKDEGCKKEHPAAGCKEEKK